MRRMTIKIFFFSIMLLSFNIQQYEFDDYTLAKKLLIEFDMVSESNLVLNDIGDTKVLIHFLNEELKRSKEEEKYRPINSFIKNNINTEELDYFKLQSATISWDKDKLSIPNLVMKKDLNLQKYKQISLCYISKPVYTLNHDYALIYYEFNNHKLIYVYKKVNDTWCKHTTIGKWFLD